MIRHAAGLERYISQCHFSSPTDQFNARIFDHGITHDNPVLISGQVNRILLYPGCFNPPHIAHKALLHTCFASSEDINAIAAIILPMDDEAIGKKCPDNLILGKEQRVQLWQDHVPYNKYWIYDRSVKQWHAFRRRLENATRRDGFELRFTVIYGSDYLDPRVGPRYRVWDCREAIVSNAGRRSEVVSADGGLRQLCDCSPWKVLNCNKDELRKIAKEKAELLTARISMIGPKSWRAMLDKGASFLLRLVNILITHHFLDPDFVTKLTKSFLSEQVSRIKQVRFCVSNKDPNGWIRFVSARNERASISSTMIREIISTHDTPLYHALEDLVLRPEMLVEFVYQQQTEGGGGLQKL